MGERRPAACIPPIATSHRGIAAVNRDGRARHERRRIGEQPGGGLGKFVFDASAHESRNLFTLDVRVRTNDAYLDAHTLINGSIGFTNADERYQVRIIGRNLGNQGYRTGAQTVGSLFRYSIYGEPRYHGLEIGVKFGGTR